ncbi:MAG: histidine kinase, partial [Leptospiraceae bacterium]|nr:histidine kinase [Leptospiraceae bacterium]
MARVIKEIDDNLEITEDKNFFELKTYRISPELEKSLHEILEKLLANSPRPHLLPLLYTIIKELAINACKANQKRVFFEEKGYNIFNPNDYAKGIVEYKASFSENMGLEYGPKSKAKGYY